MSAITFETIFDAIADDKAEANKLQKKADLMIAIRDIDDSLNLNDIQFANSVGLWPLEMRSILKGHIDELSVNRLMNYLEKDKALVTNAY